MQQERRLEFNKLYSLRGFQYCCLLLALDKVDEVIERAQQTLEWIKPFGDLLSIALDQLSLGKALFQKAQKEDASLMGQAAQYLDQAVEGLREASQVDYLCLGLLARAACHNHQNQQKSAWQDLDEVYEFASHSGALLFLTDYHLEACRNIHKQLSAGGEFLVIENGETLHPERCEMQARFERHLVCAEKLINDTGYHLRDGELAELKES